MFDFSEFYEMGFTRAGDTQQMQGVEFVMQLVSAGDLQLPSGQLVACDPFELPETAAFTTKVAAGVYPVDLAYIRFMGRPGPQRIRFARIKLSEEVPVSFEMAVTAEQDVETLEDGEVLGYPVETGSGCFLDRTSLAVARQRDSAASSWQDLMSDEFDKNETEETDGFLNFQIESDTSNIIAFRTFEGDGIMPTFIGRDAQQRVCCFVSSL